MTKYYAVKNGRKKGIYLTWEECKEQVFGFSGAVYKSFLSKAEAEAFLEINDSAIKHEAECVAFVDGSYDQRIRAYGSGAVIFYHQQKYTWNKMGNDEKLVDMRNVAGEIEASQYAMQFALDHHCASLEICFDYLGIQNWCTGAWQANKPGTKAYRDFYLEISKQVKITFTKIKSHSNHALNDEADHLAKQALGLC